MIGQRFVTWGKLWIAKLANVSICGYFMFMFEEESRIAWDVKDIQMAIKRYFHKLDRNDLEEANLEIEFMRSIHREWSYHPLMRRTAPDAMAIIDDFLKWFDSTPLNLHTINDFTIRRLIR